MAQVGINSNGFVLNIGTTIDQGQIKKCKADLDKFKAEAEKNGKVNITINYDKAKGTKTQIEQITQATGEFATVVSKLNAQGQPLEQVITSVGTKANNASQNISKLNGSLNDLNSTGQKGKNIFSDFTTTFMKMAKFNTINLIYDGLITKMRECIEITNEFDVAMTEFKKVTDTSALSLSDYVAELSKLGELTASTTTEMISASTEFSKGGFNADDSAKLAQVANLYMNIADAELSAGEAASYVISQMKAFDLGVDDAISIIDKTNEVKLLLTSINCVNFWKAKTLYTSCQSKAKPYLK